MIDVVVELLYLCKENHSIVNEIIYYLTIRITQRNTWYIATETHAVTRDLFEIRIYPIMTEASMLILYCILLFSLYHTTTQCNDMGNRLLTLTISSPMQ